MDTSLQAFLQSQSSPLNAHLMESIQTQEITPTLKDAMMYSLEAGGKRVRPMLLLAVLEEFKQPLERGYDAACALEYIHTYSLIHDDLPAMDNDDLRRGKPTNHIVFGEATAILAGDALLTEAFALISQSPHYTPVQKVELIQLLSRAAGAPGMVGGQLMDIEAEGKTVDLLHLQKIHALKTGALLKFSIDAGALLANADERDRVALCTYAEAIGVLFQIQDDILDVEASSEELGKTAGKDQVQEKSTYPALLTVHGAKHERDRYFRLALDALRQIGKDKGLLEAFANYIAYRGN
ncbi:polyprenyl synthetase family protein [Chryseomicrobium palamuruense]|uniref:Polyprenyl synthetase family protein n=1 Tax=Chryseomicrobium palamuruense TaxID=682973 RepID=A0ABV8UXZ6_9BACL